MKTTLYYFSGTGNSLKSARDIASKLGESVLIPIASFRESTGDIMTPAGRVGFICPVYDFGIPVAVHEFLKRLVPADDQYLFAVLTYGGSGGSALRMVNAALQPRFHRNLDAGFMVKMPGNFPPISPPPQGEKKQAILRSADHEIERICRIVQECRKQPVGLYPVSSLIRPLIYGSFARNVHSLDEKFTISDACTSCGVCASVCPVGNIEIREGRPVYLHKCELCCGCLNYCPVQAIDLKMMFGTRGRGRYHHPAVSVPDMKAQQDQGS